MNNIEDHAKQFKNACDYISEAIKTDAGKAAVIGLFAASGFLLKAAFSKTPENKAIQQA